jgi:hypothetical protein
MLRAGVIAMLEAATVEPDPDRRKRMLTFAVAGRGFAGVETVGAITKRLDAKRMFGHAWNSEIVRLRPKRQNEVIKRQLSRKNPDSVGDRQLPSRKVDRFDFPTQNGYMSKQFAKRIADVGRLEVASCHLVKHRRKESEIFLLTRVTSTSARFAAVRSRYRAASPRRIRPPK